MKGNINKYGCLLWSKKEIAVPKHLSCCWRSIKRGGGFGGAIEMQMLMTVAEDNHSRSAQAQCDRVDAVCGSQQTHPRRAATCCGLVRIDGKNKLGLCPNSHYCAMFQSEEAHAHISDEAEEFWFPPTSVSVFQSRVHPGVREEHGCSLNP